MYVITLLHYITLFCITLHSSTMNQLSPNQFFYAYPIQIHIIYKHIHIIHKQIYTEKITHTHTFTHTNTKKDNVYETLFYLSIYPYMYSRFSSDFSTEGKRRRK